MFFFFKNSYLARVEFDDDQMKIFPAVVSKITCEITTAD